MRDESDVHVTLSHKTEPNLTLNLDAGGWNWPKLAPAIVTRNPPRRGPIDGVKDVTRGRSYENHEPGTDSTRPTIVKLNPVRATGASLVGGSATTREESDTQVTFAGVALTNIDDDALMKPGENVPKLLPVIVKTLFTTGPCEGVAFMILGALYWIALVSVAGSDTSFHTETS